MEWQFRCPRDHGSLEKRDDLLICANCGTAYPIISGVPVLINDANSVFAVADYAESAGYWGASYGQASDTTRGVRRVVRRSFHWLAQSNSSIRHLSWADALEQVRQIVPEPRVLVVGSGGQDYRVPGVDVLHTDVAFGPHVEVLADAHDIPIPDRQIDLVLAIAVLEHVADPQRCVAEIQRVLKPGGYVYAITPFLQPVHMGAYDFTRFTPLGHRRLFRWFDVIDAGVSTGIGSVAAWTVSAFLQSISGRRFWRRFSRATALLCTPPLRKLDRWLAAPAHFDAAGSMYLFGKLRSEPVPDRRLIQDYRGGYRRPVA
ncbi:MAG TPA: methyltransferase domain-containing protein [Acetobacteraceae bacterium]|nr:methyltransferase domain-containing protein [Acetobacteraceae bacterium]